MIRKIFLLVMLVLTTFVKTVSADTDEYHSRILREYVLPLKWENIHNYPFWMGGVEPCYDSVINKHVFILYPDEFTIVKLPREERIHIVPFSEPLTERDLDIYASNGSGLYTKKHLKCREDGRTLVYKTDAQEVNVVKIVNRSKCAEPIKIAVFLSTRYPIERTIRYTDLIELCNPVIFVPAYQAGIVRYFRFDPNKPERVTVKGPARINLQSRFIYPDKESSLFQAWRINIKLDDTEHRNFLFRSTFEKQYPMHLDEYKMVTSREENGYFDVPPGDHTIEIKSSAPVFLRMLASYCDDYLFSFNDPANIPNLDPDVALFEYEHIAWKLSWDNRYRYNGLMGMAILNKMYLERPDLDPLRDSYDKIYDQSTFYRDILPQRKFCENQHYLRFLQQELRNIGQDRLPIMVSPQFISDYVSRFDAAYFNLLAEDPDSDEPRTFIYELPKRKVPGFARVLVDLTDDAFGQYFWVQIDNHAPFEVHTSRAASFADKEYIPTEGGGLLTLLVERFCDKAIAGTLSEAFNYFTPFKGATLIQAGIVEFKVPENANIIKIWKKEGACKPLRVALQVRDSRVFNLSEFDFLTVLDKAKCKMDVLNEFMTAVKTYPNIDCHNELINNWLPAIRLINSQYRSFFDTVIDPVSEKNKKTPADFNKRYMQAKTMVAQKNSVGAIELLSKLVFESSGDKKYEAKLLLAEALEQQGEAFLSEQERKSIIMNSKNKDLAMKAYQDLERIYKSVNNSNQLQQFYAAGIVLFQDKNLIKTLLELFTTDEEYLNALYVGLLLDEKDQPLETLIDAAFYANWYNLFNELMLRVENDDLYDYWMDRYYRIQGQYAEAQAIENNACKTKEPQNWFERPDLVRDYQSFRYMYSVERDLYEKFFIATKERPVKIKVEGPAMVRVGARAIHKKGNLTSLNGWLKIKSKDQLWVTSINNSMPSQGLELVGHESEVPGYITFNDLYIDAGCHELEVGSTEFGILTAFWVKPIESPLEKYDVAKTGPTPNATLEAQYLFKNDYESALKLPVGKTPDDIVRRLNLLLWMGEQNRALYPKALAMGSALAQENIAVTGVSSILRRLQSNSLWTLMTNVESSAGLRIIRLEGWQPETPAVKIRGYMLNKPVEPGEQIILGTEELIYAIDNKESTTLNIQFTEDDILNLPALPMTALYSVDENEPAEVSLTPKNRSALVNIQVPEGSHTIKFSIKSPIADQVLRIKMDEKDPRLAVTTIDRPYYISTVQTPIEYTINGPAWVRMDEYRDGITISKYFYVAENVKSLKQMPEKGQSEGLFRIFTLMPMSGRPVIAMRYVPEEKVSVPEYDLTVNNVQICQDVLYRNTAPLETYYTGTWSFKAAYRERLDTQSVGLDVRSTTGLPRNLMVERFHEYSAHYWYYSEHKHLYYQTTLLGRPRFEGGPTLGIIETIDYYPPTTPWSYQFEMSAFAQSPGDKVEWSVNTAAKVFNHRQLGTRAEHTPFLTVYARVLSLSKNQSTLYPSNFIDNDVYTKYKAMHRYGIGIGDRFIYHPWLDAQIPIEVSVFSNEDLNLATPDNVATSIGYNQYVDSLRFDLDYKHVWYLKYRDRLVPYKTRSIYGAVTYEDLKACNPFELQFSVQREIDFKKTLYGVMLFWHMDYEGFYRDYPRRGTNFLELRRLELLKRSRPCNLMMRDCKE